jgi:protease I
MRIACLLDNDFEDSTFRKPYDALEAAGHDVVVIGLERDSKLTGKQRKEVTRSDRGSEAGAS